MTHKINSIKGMEDILPCDSHKWLQLENIFRNILEYYAYHNIRTPILEHTQLFKRAVGDDTDIVGKEMYSFVDMYNQDQLTLRPELTASVIRSVIEHNLLYNGACKLWTLSAVFRHERPQRGRNRQFHQLSVEALGYKSCYIDTELMLMQRDIYRACGVLQYVKLEINCLGSLKERVLYREQLVNFLKQHYQELDDDSKRRLSSNPLRILDSKLQHVQDILKHAPRLIEYLGHESLTYYNEWKDQLRSLGLDFIENCNLVRGLDYYTGSVFEWVADVNGPLTISAGGRYDGLIATLGGSANFAIGFGLGVERLLILMQQAMYEFYNKRIDVFIAIHPDEEWFQRSQTYAFEIANILRDQQLSVLQCFDKISLPKQLKRANQHRAKFVIIIGMKEVDTRCVTIKNMDLSQEAHLSQSNFVNYIME